MSAVFADTLYFLALINPEDLTHQRVFRWSRDFTGDVVTTEYVLVEFADGMARSRRRREAAGMIEKLRKLPGFRIVAAEERWLTRGLELFRDRPDKQWSLTDCISFLVMEQQGLREALTGDRHFAQAGFAAVFAE